jgi:hypothetical protein
MGVFNLGWTAPFYGAPVRVSFLLRLAPEHLAERRIAGRLEVVATGENFTVHDADELIELLHMHAGSGVRPNKEGTT